MDSITMCKCWFAYKAATGLDKTSSVFRVLARSQYVFRSPLADTDL